jgi:hypothetical protein
VRGLDVPADPHVGDALRVEHAQALHDVHEIGFHQRVAHPAERRRRVGAARVHLHVADDEHLDRVLAVAAAPWPGGISQQPVADERAKREAEQQPGMTRATCSPP